MRGRNVIVKREVVIGVAVEVIAGVPTRMAAEEAKAKSGGKERGRRTNAFLVEVDVVAKVGASVTAIIARGFELMVG